MRELLNALFASRTGGDAGRLARFAFVGAFVLGVLPASAEVLAPAQKAVTDVGASKSAAKAEAGKVNVGPRKAFITRGRQANEQGKLNLSKPQTITVEGDRQDDGTLTNVSITGESASDPELRKVAQDFVSSLNESRGLAFLSDVSHVRMNFALDAARFRVESASDAPSEPRADEMARGYRMLVNAGRLMRRGTDEGAVLNN